MLIACRTKHNISGKISEIAVFLCSSDENNQSLFSLSTDAFFFQINGERLERRISDMEAVWKMMY